MVALIPGKRKTNYWSSSVTDPGMKKANNPSVSDLTSQFSSPKFVPESVDFVSKTLFRTPPVFSCQNYIDLAPVGFCIKKHGVVLSWFEDPEWPYLEMAYAFPIKLFAKHKMGPSSSRVFIQRPFVEKLLGLFHSEDEREGTILEALLSCIYKKFTDIRKFIRNRVFNRIRWFNDPNSAKHNGIPYLLFFLGDIVKDSGCSLIDREFGASGEFPLRLLVPLLRSKWDLMFYPQLIGCIVPMLQKVGSCLCSPLFLVVDRALWLLRVVIAGTVEVRLPIKQNVQDALPIVSHGLVKVTINHWQGKTRWPRKKVCRGLFPLVEQRVSATPRKASASSGDTRRTEMDQYLQQHFTWNSFVITWQFSWYMVLIIICLREDIRKTGMSYELKRKTCSHV